MDGDEYTVRMEALEEEKKSRTQSFQPRRGLQEIEMAAWTMDTRGKEGGGGRDGCDVLRVRCLPRDICDLSGGADGLSSFRLKARRYPSSRAARGEAQSE